MNRDLQYATLVGPSSSATGLVVASLSFVDPAASQDSRYVIMADGVGNTSTAAGWDAQLVQVGFGALAAQGVVPSATTDYASAPMMYPWSSGTVDFELDYLQDGGTITARQASIVALALCDLDVCQTGTGATSSTSYTALVNVPLTVPSDGYYLIRATARPVHSTTASKYFVKLVVNGADYGEQYADPLSTTRGVPWMTFVRVLLTAGSYTLSIYGKAETSGTLTINDGCILALREDMLPGILYAESRGDANISTSDPTWTNRLTLSPRTQNQSYLMFSCGLLRRAAAGRINNMRVQLDGSDITVIKVTNSAATNEYAISTTWPLASGTAPSAGPHSVTLDGAKGVGEPGNLTSSEAALCMLHLKDNTTIYAKGGQILGGQLI